MILMLIINSTNLFPFQVSELLFRLEYFRFVKSAFSITCELSIKIVSEDLPKKVRKAYLLSFKKQLMKNISRTTTAFALEGAAL